MNEQQMRQMITIRAESAAWLRKRYPDLHTRLDRAFALLDGDFKSVEWVAMPGNECNGVTVGVALPVTVALIHIHFEDHDSDEDLAVELGRLLIEAIVETDRVVARMAGQTPPSHTFN